MALVVLLPGLERRHSANSDTFWTDGRLAVTPSASVPIRATWDAISAPGGALTHVQTWTYLTRDSSGSLHVGLKQDDTLKSVRELLPQEVLSWELDKDKTVGGNDAGVAIDSAQ